MPLYARKWDCGICDQPVIYDSEKNTISCGCSTIEVENKPLDFKTNWIRILEVEPKKVEHKKCQKSKI